MKRCYLIRHGQTVWNHENRLQGHSDVPLSPAGLHQARCVGRFFSSHRLRYVYTSQLARSCQTAQAIISASGHRHEPIVEPDLAEIYLGAWEGLMPEEIDLRFNGAYKRWARCSSEVTIPDAESMHVFQRRVRDVFHRITASYSEGEVVVVSHGGVIAALLADALGADYDILLRSFRLDNGSITALDISTTPLQVLWANATSHLSDEGTDGCASG